LEKVLVAKKLANKLFAAEASVDAAIEASMTLLAGMAEARKEAGVSATVGNSATAKVAEAIAILAQARTAVVEAHAEMDQVKLRLGIRTKLGILPKDAPPAFLPSEMVSDRDVA
jgi:hypothetical protein